jgi:CHASE2 domain-containing sensor protein
VDEFGQSVIVLAGIFACGALAAWLGWWATPAILLVLAAVYSQMDGVRPQRARKR